MAVATTISSVNYAGTNTGDQVCPIPFIWYDETDIVVTLVPASGSQTTLVVNSGFTLTGTGNPSGGSAILFSPVPTTTTINIARNVPATQETSFVTGDRFPASIIERALDKATMLVQQFLRSSNRTLRFGPEAPEYPELTSVPTSGQRVLGSQNGVLSWRTPAEVGLGDNSVTDRTLRFAPTAPVVPQLANIPTTGSFVLGSTAGNLSWQTSPSVVIADGAVTTAKLANGSVTTAKLDSSISFVPDGTITNAKLAANCVTSANIAPGTIVDTDVADNSVTDAKLSATGVAASTIPANTAVNQIPRITITTKGRITSATATPIAPYVQALKFAESNTGEVGYHPFLSGSIFLDSKGSLRAAGANTNGRMGIGVDALATNGPSFVTIPFVPTDANETISKFWVQENNIFVLSSTGKLYGCGNNSVGQLGTGNTTASSVLIRIGTLSNVVDFAVSLGGADDSCHCLAVLNNGQVWGWGANNYGQLGLGNTTSPINVPTQVTGPTAILASAAKCYAWGGAAGGGFSYIILNNGDVYSTGRNEFGQLGLGDNADNNVFEKVPTLKADALFGNGGVNATAAAYRRGAVWLVRNGEVWATGSNVGGTLGYGDTTDKNGFVKLSLTNVVDISCSNGYAGAACGVCARLSDGTIRVWGDNSQGQLGIGSATVTFATPQAHPTALAGRTIVKTQFIGSNHTGANLVVLDSVGDIWVAGYQGRLFGRGIAVNVNQTTFLKALAPVPFSDFRVYGRGGADFPTILAETTLGELWAWGNNSNFQCGVGAGVNISVPQRVII